MTTPTPPRDVLAQITGEMRVMGHAAGCADVDNCTCGTTLLRQYADRIERALAVQGEVDVRVFRICEHCHQEYMLTFGPTGISNFGPCPNCKRRDDPWIRVARTQEPR